MARAGSQQILEKARAYSRIDTFWRRFECWNKRQFPYWNRWSEVRDRSVSRIERPTLSMSSERKYYAITLTEYLCRTWARRRRSTRWRKSCRHGGDWDESSGLPSRSWVDAIVEHRCDDVDLSVRYCNLDAEQELRSSLTCGLSGRGAARARALGAKLWEAQKSLSSPGRPLPPKRRKR